MSLRTFNIIIISFLLTTIFTQVVTFAQQPKPVKVQVRYDTTAIPEIFSQVPIGFIFTFPDQHKEATQGFLHGKLRWRKLEVHSEMGNIRQGRFYFDQQKIWDHHHQADFEVTYKDTTLYCTFLLPYLQAVHFNLYTDSIKRGVPFSLNIEGTFSSGKVYPLDTGMIRFQTSAGTISQNTFVLPQEDSLMKSVKIKGTFKWDPALADSCIVPVKTQTENVHLPTEKQLLKQWKQKRRQK